MEDTVNPTPAGDNGLHKGRDGRGRFAVGNRGGQGNPLNAKVQKLRSTLIQAITQADIRAVIRKLIELAKGGDTAAAKILFDRVFGNPNQKIEYEQVGGGPVEIRVIQDPDWYGNADQMQAIDAAIGNSGTPKAAMTSSLETKSQAS